MTKQNTLLLEKSDEGLLIGRDPRKCTRDELSTAGHVKKSLNKVIREKCIDCCAGEQAEVRKCTATSCALWPYRMNKNVFSDRKGNPNAVFGRKGDDA